MSNLYLDQLTIEITNGHEINSNFKIHISTLNVFEFFLIYFIFFGGNFFSLFLCILDFT